MYRHIRKFVNLTQHKNAQCAKRKECTGIIQTDIDKLGVYA